MQQRKTTRPLSRVRRFQFFFFLYWLHFCEIVELPVPPKIERFAIRSFSMATSFIATFGFSVLVMQKEAYVGLSIFVAYLGLVATRLIYLAYTRLSRPRFHWIGE